jgi:two-component system, OmpR family, sensor kinase
MTRSLQRTLNRRIIAATTLFALLASAVSGWVAFNEAREWQDNLLRQVATLVESQSTTGGLLDRDIDPEDTLVLQRLGDRPPHSLPLPSDLDDGLYTLQLNGVGWRVLVYTGHQSKARPGGRFAVSQQTEARDEVAWNNSLHTLLPVLLLAPLLLIVVGYAVRQSVKPVSDLAEAVDRRGESSLAPLPDTPVPREIAPFVASINRLLERLRRAIEQQHRFVADAAHELRTPIAGLSLLAENLAAATTLEASRQQLIPLQEGLSRMQALVAQLLDLARLQGEAQPVNERVDLQRIVQAVIAELYPLAERKSIDLGMPRNEPLAVMDVSGNLRILVRNGLENAIRYTPDGGRVDVSLFGDRADAVLLIEDTGCGIPAQALSQVFEPFYRVGGDSEPGNGLGLAISQEIACQLGGRITLRNRPDGGLQFRYTQPRCDD